MDIETIGLISVVGFVFAAATLGRVAYERHMDVLYGPYIEGRNKHPRLGSVVKPRHPLIDRLPWRMRDRVNLTSITAC